MGETNGATFAKFDTELGKIRELNENQDRQLHSLVQSNWLQAQSLQSMSTSFTKLETMPDTMTRIEQGLLGAATGKTHVPLVIFAITTSGLFMMAFIAMLSAIDLDIRASLVPPSIELVRSHARVELRQTATEASTIDVTTSPIDQKRR